MAFRAWCFTLHIESEDFDVKSLWNPTTMLYLVTQMERGADTGALHLQGAVRMKNPTRLTAMKKTLGDRAHLEKAVAWEKAVEYCQKEETRVKGPWIFGEAKGAGHRSDLDSMTKMVVEGRTMREVALADPVGFARYSKGLQVLQQTIHRPQAVLRRCALFWGKTGTGKTKTVFDNWNDTDIYTVFNITVPWFDGYCDEQVALLDECGAGMMDINILKRITDRYPTIVPIKGGSARWHASTVILTSNTPLEHWYGHATHDDMEALRRRIECFEFPRQKEQAEAWCRGRMSKRERETEDDEIITVLGDMEPAVTWVDDEE